MVMWWSYPRHPTLSCDCEWIAVMRELLVFGFIRFCSTCSYSSNIDRTGIVRLFEKLLPNEFFNGSL